MVGQTTNWELECSWELTQVTACKKKRLNQMLGMEQLIFSIFIDYRGRHRKGVAIYNATSVNLQLKPWFHGTKNVFLDTTERFKQ